MAAAHLLDAGPDLTLLEPRIAQSSLNTVQHMLARHINCSITSSAGRLFDAVAALCNGGGRDRVSYEGQAAVQLEWQADADSSSQESFPYEIAQPHAHHEANARAVAKLNSRISNLKSEISNQEPQSPLIIDTRPLIRALVEELLHNQPASTIAHRFHITIACMIADVCRTLAARTGITRIVLSGGVFMNVLLLRETRRRLADAGLQVFSHHQVPPNDGGLSLGQLAVAAARLQHPPKENATDVPWHSRPRD